MSKRKSSASNTQCTRFIVAFRLRSQPTYDLRRLGALYTLVSKPKGGAA